MELTYDVIIIGGGAAGTVAAVTAAERGRKVLLLEKADRLGRKILASGNGRCNLMNNGDLRYFGDPEFACRVLRNTTPGIVRGFWERYGLFVREEDDGRVYPVTNQSASVLTVLKTALSVSGAAVMTNAPAVSVIHTSGVFEVKASGNTRFRSGKLIVSCGGAAQPKLGGCTDGYRILESFGHTMIPASPALVPLVTDRKSVSGLSGIRARCIVTVWNGDNPVHREKGEVLFADYGISGICAMQCARFVQETGTVISLDLLSSVFQEPEDMLRELRRRKELFTAFSPVQLLNGILPDKLSYAVLKQAGIPLRGETVSQISDVQLDRIIRTGYGYRLSVCGTRGLDYAQVTSGGIDCSGFDPLSMESEIRSGLYAAGEVLNVDGDCGGFNLMFAFSSGMTAGNAV